VEKEEIVHLGGSIDNALKGEYYIDVKNVLQEAWRITLQSRVSINFGLLFVIALGMLSTLIASQFFGGMEKVTSDPQAFMMINILITLIVWPFLAGVEMMGVFHAVGLRTTPKLVFAFLKRGSWVAICALLTSTLVSIGLQLLVLPGIFLVVALSLTIPLVVEKKLSPLKAISVSVLATRFQWFKLFTIYFILVLLLAAALIPIVLTNGTDLSILAIMLFLFCLTYLVPLYYNVKGILYREIFGMQLKAIEGAAVSNDNIFSA